MKKYILYMLSAMIITSCTNSNKNNESETQEETKEMTTVTLTQAQVDQLHINIGNITTHSFEGTIKANGKLEVDDAAKQDADGCE